MNFPCFVIVSLLSRGFFTLLQSPHGLMFRAGCSGPGSRIGNSAAPLFSCFAVSALLLDLELIWCNLQDKSFGFPNFLIMCSKMLFEHLPALLYPINYKCI